MMFLGMQGDDVLGMHWSDVLGMQRDDVLGMQWDDVFRYAVGRTILQNISIVNDICKKELL